MASLSRYNRRTMLPRLSQRISLKLALYLTLTACLPIGACQSPVVANEDEPLEVPEYSPISMDAFLAGGPERHESRVQEREAIITVERVDRIERESCGLHLLQPLRDIERDPTATDLAMAAGFHYLRSRNRYSTFDQESYEREDWLADWEEWPVSIERLLPNSELSLSLWDKGGYRGFWIELTIQAKGGRELRAHVEPLGDTMPFVDWCGFRTFPGESVTDLSAVLVADGVYYLPFSVRDLVLADSFPTSLVVAEGLSHDEAHALLKRFSR
ncbi:MAG: hypothetical protein ACI8X5_000627 [Planctomycetota bacterium]|jgi:hypothetical protein